MAVPAPQKEYPPKSEHVSNFNALGGSSLANGDSAIGGHPPWLEGCGSVAIDLEVLLRHSVHLARGYGWVWVGMGGY